jgi:hypothetical protein
LFAADSYVLHFQGKSTWRGPESEEQRRLLDRAFLDAFRAKWGQRLLEVMLLGRLEVVRANPAWWREWNRSNFGWVIKQLIEAEESGPKQEFACSAASGDASSRGGPPAASRNSS